MLKKLKYALFTLVLMAGCVSALADAPAAPSPTSQSGRPISILFLGDTPSSIDAQYAAELKAAGIEFATVSYYQSLPYDFLRRFNVVVVEEFPKIYAEYQLFGQRMVIFRENINNVWRCGKEGAGVLVYSNLNDAGGWVRAGWNREMKPWGAQILQMCVRDPATAFISFRVYGDSYYCWTENFTPHALTAGLKRYYYPSVNGRWDDCYSSPPLICDKSWTPLVRGMPTATAITETNQKEYEEKEHKGDTTLAAVRALGQGRLGVISMNPAFIHQLGYTPGGKNSECNWGPVDGIILSKGDGKVPSDTGKFVQRMYAWLAQNSYAAKFGGYKAGDALPDSMTPPSAEALAFDPQYNPDSVPMPPSWRHRAEVVKRGDDYFAVEVTDPNITGPLHYFKGLIGVHSAASDGKGTVPEYVKAAKAAGYSLIAFTEDFEYLTPTKYAKLVADCEKYSTPDFFCLPGVDVQDRAGNHFILAGLTEYLRKPWLSADGKRLVMTAYINLTQPGQTVIAHRPLQGPLPYERLKHFQGLSVYTYRNGKLVEDASRAYAWQAAMGSNPHPVSVHEVFSPSEVSAAARTGYQQIMPSDTVTHAGGNFRAGYNMYFECPSRHILSEGPTVYDFTANLKDVGPAKYGREQFRVAVGVKSEAPLRSVMLYDGFTALRRWLPKGNDFHATVDLQHAQQHALYVVAEDMRGKKALTSSIRTVGHHYASRCADRQNWLGDVPIIYTGTFLPPKGNEIDIMMPIKGTDEASRIMPDVVGTNMAPKLAFPIICDDYSLTDIAIEDRYTDALFDAGDYRIGYDATPSQPSVPSTVYAAKMRYYNFTAGGPGSPNLCLAELEIKLKRDVEPVKPDGLFPALVAVKGNTTLWFQDGRIVRGTITPQDVIDIPVGGMVGNIVALSPGLQIRNNVMGVAPPAGSSGVIKAGTTWRVRFLIPAGVSWRDTKAYSFDGDPEKWGRAMGLLGETPYKLSLTRGKLLSTTGFANLSPQNEGVAGTVEQTAALPFLLPLHIEGLNTQWPAGTWREGEKITYSGIYEDAVWARLDTAKAGKFYAGNLVCCDNKSVAISVIKWDDKSIRLEVHNPTDAAIQTTVTTPEEITGYHALKKTVEIPAGTSIIVE